MVDVSSLAKLFESKGVLKEQAISLSARLLQACPWLESDDEISEDIGRDLLNEAVDSSPLGNVGIDELIKWHNSTVRKKRVEPQSGKRDAYAELCSLIRRFGVENAFGDGDYWVVADSFPTTHVSIVKFADSKVTSDLQDELRTWLSSNHGVSST